MPLLLNMWIGSRIHFTARQPHASPPGYQSPALGDNTPDLGSQDALGVQPHHMVEGLTWLHILPLLHHELVTLCPTCHFHQERLTFAFILIATVLVQNIVSSNQLFEGYNTVCIMRSWLVLGGVAIFNAKSYHDSVQRVCHIQGCSILNGDWQRDMALLWFIMTLGNSMNQSS